MIPVVTQIRVSDDYSPDNSQWIVGDTSMLAHAVGLAAFKDVSRGGREGGREEGGGRRREWREGGGGGGGGREGRSGGREGDREGGGRGRRRREGEGGSCVLNATLFVTILTNLPSHSPLPSEFPFQQ